ncbi:hypothetical protein Glove_243g121 [Diversispora epigaea]|uniref:Uncharacterized protein n=1 Tax=Diversispora epigaea TaxID=1348612 RepID=A0A397IDH4_9GLOM|nr:hypothetical protein Glove_243g121 [Diversispora epigaea]
MSDFNSLVAHQGSKCSNEEWTEYCWMEVVRSDETPAEWRDRILFRLMYFKENDLFLVGAKHLTHARKLFRYSDGTTYAPENGFAISHKCNQLVYIGEKVGGYNHGGILKHWITSCSVYIPVSFEEVKRLKQKSKYQRSIDDTYVLREYELWMKNAIRKIERAREIGKKIRAVNIIAQKWLEYIYYPDGMTAKELAQHYQLLWTVREEMRQVNNA